MRKYLFILLFLPLFICGQQPPSKPLNYVTDEAKVLSQNEQKQLNNKLRAFENSTSNQIFVYLAPSLKGKDMAEFCQQLFTTWKIGNAGKDNGVLVAVFTDDHEFRIQTGYGLEGNLPDILTKRIQDENMGPWFKTKDYYKGIDAGIDKLIYYSSHNYAAETAPSPALQPSTAIVPEYVPMNKKQGDYIFIGIMALFFYCISGIFLWAVRSSIKSNTKHSEKAKKTGRMLATIFFFIPFFGAFFVGIVGVVFGKRGRGGRGGSSFGSSSSSSGSGFSGGGGGRSGGGGSNSSW